MLNDEPRSRIAGLTVPITIGGAASDGTRRRPAQRPFFQLVANLLIQLMVVGPLPADFQLRAALLPMSLVWMLVDTARAQEPDPASVAPASIPLSDGPGVCSAEARRHVLHDITTFTTKPFTAPVFDTNAITFSFPAANGLVTVTVPANEPPFLPPGTEILIINAGNGDVATFTVGNDGSVNGEIRASIDDRLLITVTAPDGSVTTYERSQYVNPETGETAVGPGGGVVTGPGGVELRIPEGATDKGVKLKIEGFTLEDLPEDKRQLPDLGSEGGEPIAHFASGLRTTSPDLPTFKKEVDLVFPVPVDAPAGAFFYVLRRIEVPNGEPMFAAIDIAKIEGEGAGAKVVTQSPPYASYTNSFGSFGLDGTIGASTSILHFLMWTYAPEFLNKPSVPGSITGLVQRAKADGTSEAIGGVPVYAKVAGRRLNTFGWSQGGTGRFTFWNTEPATDAVIEIEAVSGGVTKSVTAFDADLDDPNVSALRFYRRVSTGNITFPAVAPPPPAPEVDIRFMKVTADGQRVPITSGIITVGTPVQVVLSARNGTPMGAEVQGRSCTVVRDGAGTVGTVDFTNDGCAPAVPGAYTLTARALSNTGNVVKESAKSFLLVAAGGGNTTSVAGPPRVLTVVPRDSATGVAVTVFPQISFSEPVRVRSHVTLSAGSVILPATLLGITPQGDVVDVTANPDAPVTSVTLQPVGGLKYSTPYTLKVAAGVEDLDEQPSVLGTDATTVFTTFGPESVGRSDDSFGSPGIVALDNRAYLVQNNFRNGYLWAFDITDPVAPTRIGGMGVVTWRPVDIAGELESGVSDGRLVVVATGPTNESKPSNIYAFDVSDDAGPRWVAAASVTATAQEGFITRLTVKDGVAYAATFRKGIQIIDFGQPETRVPYLGSVPDNRFVQAFNTNEQGKNQEYVRSIKVDIEGVNGAPARPAYVSDLKAADLAFDGTSARLVVAAGEVGLLVLHPATEEALFRGPLGGVAWGEAVVVGPLNGRSVAILAGSGAEGRKLVAIDLTNPRQPVVLGSVVLTGVTTQITDLVLHNGLVLVGTSGNAVIVNVSDPTRPRVTGTLAGVGGRLAVTDAGLLLSTARSVFGGETPLGGVQTAALDSLTYFRRITPTPFALAGNRNTVPVEMEVGLVPANYEVQTAEVNLYREGTVVATLPVTFNSPGRAVLPAGFTFDPDFRYEAQAVINRDQPTRLASAKKALRPAQVEFAHTPEVDDGGPVDVLKVFDARPQVVLDPLVLEPAALSGYLLATVTGMVRDEIAPVTSVLIGNESVPVTQTQNGPLQLGPYLGVFTKRVQVGPEDRLVSVTAVNALGNLGWDSSWIRTNPTVTGDPGVRPVIAMESVPPSAGEASTHDFRIEVKDQGLGPAATWLLAKVDTGVEQKFVRLDRQVGAYRSVPLFLVPETFSVPAGIPSDIATKLGETRIRAQLGTMPKVTYVTDAIKDEGVASGVELVDEQGHRMRFVPGGVARPEVTIVGFDVDASSRDVAVTGTVRDPVAKGLPNAPPPNVTINGVAASVTSGSVAGTFTFTSTTRVPLPLPYSHLQVRAENMTGAFGVAGRYVTLEDEDGPLSTPEVEVEMPGAPPSTVRPFRVKVYGPRLAPTAITGAVQGIHSRSFTPALPSVALQFDEASSSGPVHVYLSRDVMLGAKIPGHDLLSAPSTPATLPQAPLVPVEVAGFVEASLSLGSVGQLTGLTDVSGLEILVPREGSIVNVAPSLSPAGDVFIGQTWKWRGLARTPSVALVQPTLQDENDAPLVSDLSSSLAQVALQAVTVSGSLPAGFETNLFRASGADSAGNTFGSEAYVFAFTSRMVANEEPIEHTISDPAALQIERGRYLLPAVTKGLELVYPGQTDVQISSHLRQNGLRPIAMKRNGGTVVTVVREDGRDVFEPLAEEVPSGSPVPVDAPPEPLLEQIVDGDDLSYRDVVDAGLRNSWMATYSAPRNYIAIQQRASLIQRAREDAGLPPAEGGVSSEYQAYKEALNADTAMFVVTTVATNWVGRVLSALGLAWAQSVAPGTFVVRGVVARGAPAGTAAVAEITSVSTAGEVRMVANAAPEVPRIAPIINGAFDFAMPTLSARSVQLASRYRSFQRLQAKSWADEVALNRINETLKDTSTELGLYAAESFVMSAFGGSVPPEKLCCYGATRGGGANDKFDEVWLVDKGTATERIVIVEAKGGKKAVNPGTRSFGAGRRVEVLGRPAYAIQGSRPYFDATLALMDNSPDANVRIAATQIREKLQAGKVEYYISSARWAGRRGTGIRRSLAWGVSRVVRIFRVAM